MIRAVVFDFGGVLMRTQDHAPRRAWETRLALPPGGLEQVVHHSDVWIAAQQGTISPEAYWAEVGARLGLSPTDSAVLQAEFFSGDRLDTSLIDLIDSLRARGLKVGLLSNDGATLENKLRDTLDIYDHFDAVAISAQIGVMKPHAASYRAIADKLGVSLPECVFIDDNTANVDGALAVGMKAIRYHAGVNVAEALEPYLQPVKVQVVIFDYGDVLDIPPDEAAWEAQRDVLAAPYGITGEALGALFYRSESWNQVKVGAITHAQYLDQILAPLGVNDPAAQEALAQAYYNMRRDLHPEMRDILARLRGRYRLCLLSNAYQTDMTDWMEREHGIAGWFDSIISSAEIGMAKPDPAIYTYTLEQLGVRPAEAIFIDNLSRNTEVAEAVGLPCIVCETPAQVREALTWRGLL